MMAKAHIVVGMAAAFTITQPESIPEMVPVVTGAALGCLIAALLEDHLIGAGMWDSLANSGSYLWCAGVAAFVMICAFASVSAHRGFAHSLPALVLETCSLWLVFPMAAKPFAVAFISHLVLDLLNKKPVRLLYPARKGFSLGLFYADRLANKVFAVAGTVWLIAVILTSNMHEL